MANPRHPQFAACARLFPTPPAIVCALVVSLLSSAACTKRDPGEDAGRTPSTSASTPVRNSRGIVKVLDTDRKWVSIAHEDIPGFMKAMTMDFPVNTPKLLEGIKVGDTVTFTFTEDGTIQSISAATPLPATAATAK